MDQVFRLLCQAEVRRLLLLMGATVSLVIAVQYLEFPSSRVLLSFFSSSNTSSFLSRDSSTGSEMLGDVMFSNVLNSTNTGTRQETKNSDGASSVNKGAAEVRQSKEKEGSPEENYVLDRNGSLSRTFGLGFNGSASDDLAKQDKIYAINNGSDLNGTASEKVMAPDISNVNADKGIASVSQRNRSTEADLGYPSAAPPIINTFFNRTFSTDENSSSMVYANASSISKSKDESFALLPRNYSLSGSGSSVSKTPAARGKKSRKPPSRVVSLSRMNDLLQQSRASSSLVRPLWPSEVDQEMLFAKSQIENAPSIMNETRLYAPLYRNVSMFKRSYELMEKMLKVYIYQDGEKPIFHQPILEGIYASEGWFLKHMEAYEDIVTKDPKKAHLFYFPFSSRLLELTLYVRHSHSRTNLIQYMRNYADSIAAKYSFWNRTGGADHFLAACHDWAPAETRGPMLNCIRALCNADIDVGFSIGKDVSLPETYVRSAQNPLKNLEGNPPSQRTILAFFAGNLHGYVRPILLQHWGNDPDMKIFGPMPHVKGNTNYIQHMKSSKFCICPRGHEVNSPRIVESIFYECVPIIISDNYVPPFFEVLDWESFAVFVQEKDIPNLKNILLSISEERYIEMHKRVKKVQHHFLWYTKPVKYDLFHMILHSVWYNRVFRLRPA